MADHVRPGPTVTLDEAREHLLSAVRTLAPNTIPLDDALGCVLAHDVVSREDVPPFANAAMDGFAVRSEDATEANARLRRAGTVTAGRTSLDPVRPGTAIAIATGAPVPDGADSVCMIEHATIEGDFVVLDSPVSVGENVRYPGEDIERGSVVFGQSTVLRPSHIGVLASIGVREVSVYPKARVGVLATGDELRTEPGPLAPGQIHDSNRHALLAAVRSMGCVPIDLGVVGDDFEAISMAVKDGQQECDAMLTSGGVSVGVADHMKQVLAELSDGAVHWMEIKIKPAKPFGFAVLSETGIPVMCMPGNPVSAMISFELMARPALRFMTGHTELVRPTLSGRAASKLSRRSDGKVHFLRVIASVDESGQLLVSPSGAQGSHQMRPMAQANALAVLPDGEGAPEGSAVQVMILDEDGPYRAAP